MQEPPADADGEDAAGEEDEEGHRRIENGNKAVEDIHEEGAAGEAEPAADAAMADAGADAQPDTPTTAAQERPSERAPRRGPAGEVRQINCAYCVK